MSDQVWKRLQHIVPVPLWRQLGLQFHLQDFKFYMKCFAFRLYQFSQSRISESSFLRNFLYYFWKYPLFIFFIFLKLLLFVCQTFVINTLVFLTLSLNNYFLSHFVHHKISAVIFLIFRSFFLFSTYSFLKVTFCFNFISLIFLTSPWMSQ